MKNSCFPEKRMIVVYFHKSFICDVQSAMFSASESASLLANKRHL